MPVAFFLFAGGCRTFSILPKQWSMPLGEIQKAVRRFVGDGDLEKALDHLSFHLSETSGYCNEVIVLRSTFNSVERELRMGTITHEDYRTQIAKLKRSILEVSGKVEPGDLQSQTEHQYIQDLEEENRKLKRELRRLEQVLQETKSVQPGLDTAILRKLSGLWLEVIGHERHAERIFSIAEFKYNRRKMEFEYNGTNYTNDGGEQFSWKSKKLLPDLAEREVYYIYSVDRPSLGAEGHIGFGLLELDDLEEERYTITKGYFFGAGSEQDPKYFDCFRMDVLLPQLNERFGLELSTHYKRTHPGLVQELHRLYTENPRVFKEVYVLD
jgi:hypothetical protein